MDKERVLKALADEWRTEAVRDDEFTTSDMREMLKVNGSDNSKDFVYQKLGRMVADNILSVRRAKQKQAGGSVNAYSPAEGKTWEDVLQYIKVK